MGTCVLNGNKKNSTLWRLKIQPEPNYERNINGSIIITLTGQYCILFFGPVIIRLKTDSASQWTIFNENNGKVLLV